MGWDGQTFFHCEINEFCTRILNHHFPNAEHYADITKTDFTPWRGRIDVLSGGFPCQPFSLAGQRKGADDDRYLWPQMLRAIREIQASWVVGENVAGILTMVQPGEEVEVGSQTSLFGEADRKRVLLRQEYVVETICRDLGSEGYSVQPFLIPACAVGAPHRRDRIWFVARLAANPDGDRCTPCAASGRIEESRREHLPQQEERGNEAERLDGLDGLPWTSSDTQCNRGGEVYNQVQPRQPNGERLTAMAVNGMLPTPTASDIFSGTPKDRKDGKSRMGELKNFVARQHGQVSQLNPLFVAEMMGFPPDWTVSPFQSGGRNPSKPTGTR